MAKQEKLSIKWGIWFKKSMIERVRKIASERRVSQQKIVEAALETFLDGKKEEDFQALLARRLNSLDNRVKVLSRQQEIFVETFALYLRMWLASNAEIPEGQKETAFLRGQERFEKFLTNLTKRISNGKSFFLDLPQEVTVTNESFKEL